MTQMFAPPDPTTRVESTPAAGEPSSWSRLLPLFLGIVAVFLWRGWSTVAVIAVITFIIFMHELGHYLTARFSDMKVTEFFLGVGPKIWSFRRGETEYGIKAIPVVAYVKTIGMYTIEDVDPADEARTYRQKSTWRRVLMASAGSMMHFLMALIAVIVLMLWVGLPSATKAHIGQVMPNSPAAVAGIQPGDHVVAVNGRPTDDWSQVGAAIRVNNGQPMTLTVDRKGRQVQLTAVPQVDADHVARIGVVFQPDLQTEGLGTAFTVYGRLFSDQFSGLARLFSPSGLTSYADTVLGRDQTPTVSSAGGSTAEPAPRPSSVIGIVNQGSGLFDQGWYGVLAFFAGVNVAFGIINMVPLMPFDGGHIAVALYERVRSRRGKRHFVDVQKLMPLTYAVVLLLGVLFLSAAWLDVTKGV